MVLNVKLQCTILIFLGPKTWHIATSFFANSNVLVCKKQRIYLQIVTSLFANSNVFICKKQRLCLQIATYFFANSNVFLCKQQRLCILLFSYKHTILTVVFLFHSFLCPTVPNFYRFLHLGKLFDCLRSKSLMSLTNLRKVFNSIAFFVPAACFLTLRFIPQHMKVNIT